MPIQHQITARQLTTVVALAAVAAVHILDLPPKFEEVPYLGFAYIGLVAASLYLIERILTKNQALDYVLAVGLNVAVILGYAINRTVGMPGATEDIGNWFEPLGLLSLIIEAWAILQAVQGWRLIKSTSA